MRLKTWVSLILVFTLVVGVSVPILANGFLSLFRKDKSNAWVIDPSDFVKMLDALEGHSSVVQIANFGVMEIIIPPEVKTLQVPDGRLTFADRCITVPTAMPGYNSAHPQMVSASKIRFTLFTGPINRFLNSLSIRTVMPSDLNNQPFVLNTAPLVAFSYRAADFRRSDVVIAITKPSMLEIPPSVSQDSLQKAILAIPGLPKGLQSQFANVSYNGKVLINPEGIGEPITIKPGVQGAFTPGPDEFFKQLIPGGVQGEQMHREFTRSLGQSTLINGLWGMRFSADCLIWLEQGLIYMVMGELTLNEALTIARMIN